MPNTNENLTPLKALVLIAQSKAGFALTVGFVGVMLAYSVSTYATKINVAGIIHVEPATQNEKLAKKASEIEDKAKE